MERLIRQHRFTLEEAMATVQPVRDFDHLLELIRDRDSELPWNPLRDVAAERVTIEPYGYDKRIGWDTYIITIKDWGVWGMANGPIPHTTS